jgi:hypothetical protein
VEHLCSKPWVQTPVPSKKEGKWGSERLSNQRN